MEERIKRMVAEWNELDARETKLREFLHGDVINTLPEESQQLLHEQCNYMLQYKQVLTKRLKLDGIDPYSQQPQAATFGDKLMGRSFNPSNLPKVDRLKELAAEMADIVESFPGAVESGSGKPTYIANTLRGDAIRCIKHACMASVAHLTNQH